MAHNRVATVVLTACVALALWLPGVSQVVVTRFERALRARAEMAPLVAGAKGSKFDLALSTMFFREGALKTIPTAELKALQGEGMGVAVGMSTRFTTHGKPLVGVSAEYFEKRGLRAESGTLPLLLGDVVLGSSLASSLGLGAGDTLFSDQRELYDISKPPSLKMHVSGVLVRSGSPDDEAAFVDLKTVWVLEGIAHGHTEATAVDDSLVLGKAEGQVVLSQALIEYNEVTAENLASFHMHADEGALPLTAVLFYPRDEKASTMAKARVNRSDAYQMVSPSAVVDELLSYVFRVKALLDTLAVVLGASTVLLAGLVVALSLRLRTRELETLHRIGCSRFVTWQLVGTELAAIVTVSVALAGIGVMAAGFVGGRLLWSLT